MSDILNEIGKHKIVPVVVLESADHAAPLGEALAAGGLPVAEVTFRTDAAAASIEVLARRGDLLVGAGTVLSTEQADRAIDAGAKFVVSPGTNPKVVEHCLSRGVPIAPGVATPTDIELAMSFGLRNLKFFPAEALGGVASLKAIGGPYRGVRFIPTGGVSLANMKDYLALPNVLAVGGSWIVKGELMSAGRFDEVQRLTAEAVAAAKG